MNYDINMHFAQLEVAGRRQDDIKLHNIICNLKRKSKDPVGTCGQLLAEEQHVTALLVMFTSHDLHFLTWHIHI